MSAPGLSLILEIACAFSLLIFGILLLLNRKKRNVGLTFLGIFLSLLSLHFFLLIIREIGLAKLHPTIDNFHILGILLFSYGPLLFVATYHYLREPDVLVKKTFLSFSVLLSPITGLLVQAITNELFPVFFSDPLIYPIMLVFLIWSLWLIKKSDIDKKRKAFIRHINLSFLFMILIWIGVIANRIAGGLLSDELLKSIFLLMLFYLIFGLAYFLVYHPQVLHSKKQVIQLFKGGERDKKHYAVLLDTDQKNTIRQRLVSLLEEDKLYLSPNLSLEGLGEKLGVSPRLVSYLINTDFDTNFSDYINSYRIEFAKRLLVNYDSKELNVSEVVYKAGFNSTSSFYEAFKKNTGVTPKEYRKRFHLRSPHRQTN